MRKFRLFITALVAVPVTAQAAEPIRVDREGYKLEYVVSYLEDGTKLITGRDVGDDTKFKLLVRGRKVTGEVGGQPVRFMAPRSKSPTKPTQVASN